MLAVGPTTARAIGLGALAANAASWGLQAVLLLGGDIVLAGLVAGASLASAAMGLPLPRKRLVAGALAVAAAAAAFSTAPFLLDAAAPLASRGRVAPWLLAALAAAGSAPLGSLVRRGTRGLPVGAVGEAVGVTAGVALAASLPPLAGGLLAAAAAALVAVPRRPAGRGAQAGADATRILPVALAAAALAHGIGALQTLADPSPAAALAAVTFAAVVATLVRAAGTRRGADAMVVALGGLLAVDVALWKGVGLARVVVLESAPFTASLPPFATRWLPLAVVAAVAGAALGLAWGPRGRGAGPFVGLLLAPVLLMMDLDAAPAVVALVGGASAVFWALSRPAQAGGVAVAVLAGVVLWVGGTPSEEALATPAWRVMRSDQERMTDAELRSATVATAAVAGPRGASALHVAEDDWDPTRGAPVPGARTDWFAESQGLRVTRTSRATEAERFGGALAGLISERSDRVLVLGDDGGAALQGLLAHPVGSVTVATPDPSLVRAIAGVAPARSEAWLDPRVRLVPRHPETLLRSGPRADVIVDVVRAPWADARHAAPTAAHIAGAARRLRDGGTYVMVLHLEWLGAGGASAVAAEVAERFDVVQAWLPPYGADSLILVAGDSPRSYLRFAERLAEHEGLIAQLGARSPADVASLAVADRRGLQAWHAAQAGALPSPLSLGPAVRQRPILHLASLAGHTGTPESLWTLQDDAEVRALTVRLEARRSFLALLAEATSGNMEAVFKRARELQESGSGVGADALEPLIAPHLRDGRRALQLALQEGLDSKQWDEALRFGTTARMLAPTSPRPLELLGDIALGKGNPETALKHFDQALELNPRSAGALTGKARVARLRGDANGALAAFQEATRAEPDNWALWVNLGNFQAELADMSAAEASIGRAIQLTDGREPRPYQVLAQLMLDDRRPDAALLTANKALDLEESGLSWFLRGRAHYELGEKARALDDFRRAIIASPGLSDPRYGVGMVLMERGELEQAAESFRMALRLNPTHTGARLSLDLVEEELRIREEQLKGGDP